MKYVPVSEGKNPDILAVLCLIAAGIAGTSSYMVHEYTWFFQLLMLVFLTIGLYVAVRYKLIRYEYRIEMRNAGEEMGDINYELAARTLMNRQPEELEFSVWKQQGQKKQRVECRFYLNELVSVAYMAVPRKKRKEILRSYGEMHLYTYIVSMDPPSPYLLVFAADGYGKVGVMIEAEETLAALLKSIALKTAAAAEMKEETV